MASSYESDDDEAVFIPNQTHVDDDGAESLRLKLLRGDQDIILARYEEELSDFKVAQESMEQLKRQKQKELKHTREEIRQMQEQIDVYRTRKANLIFMFERHALRRMPKTWYITFIPLYLFMLHFYFKGAYLLVALNTVGFVAVGRMIYVMHADYSLIFGFCIILLSWFAGTNAV